MEVTNDGEIKYTAYINFPVLYLEDSLDVVNPSLLSELNILIGKLWNNELRWKIMCCRDWLQAARWCMNVIKVYFVAQIPAHDKYK